MDVYYIYLGKLYTFFTKDIKKSVFNRFLLSNDYFTRISLDILSRDRVLVNKVFELNSRRANYWILIC